MGQIEATYALIRAIEEKAGPLLAPGQVLIYRQVSRFPWMDMIFDLPPGTRCVVRTAEYDPLTPLAKHDADDNHYYYILTNLEEHEGIVTTEIVAMFDLERDMGLLDGVADDVMRVVQSYSGNVLGKVLSAGLEDMSAN